MDRIRLLYYMIHLQLLHPEPNGSGGKDCERRMEEGLLYLAFWCEELGIFASRTLRALRAEVRVQDSYDMLYCPFWKRVMP